MKLFGVRIDLRLCKLRDVFTVEIKSIQLRLRPGSLNILGSFPVMKTNYFKYWSTNEMPLRNSHSFQPFWIPRFLSSQSPRHRPVTVCIYSVVQSTHFADYANFDKSFKSFIRQDNFIYIALVTMKANTTNFIASTGTAESICRYGYVNLLIKKSF